MFKDILGRLKEELEIEKQRYYRDRWGKIAAAMIYALAFITVPLILGEIIPRLTQFMRPEYAYILIALSTLNIVAILFNSAMVFIYRSKIPFFQQYRNNPDKPWPWQIDSKAWDNLRWRSIWKTAICIEIVGGLSLLGEVFLDFTIVMDVEKRMDIRWIILQFFLMMLAEDFFFFSSHYALHQPYLYPFHKIHHEYTNTVSLAGLHFHPLEFFITQSISTLFSIKLASLVGPMNISTLVIWLIFRMLDAFYGHSGYNFSWTPLQLLPLATYDDFHDFHHSSNSGNYGSHFRFWDSLFGTMDTFRKYKKGLKIKTK